MPLIDRFLATVPPSLRENADFALGAGLSEHEVRSEVARAAARTVTEELSFLGGGFYDDIVPAAVAAAASARKPLDFETAVARLTGMDAAVAIEDGTRALLEAVLMAGRLSGNEGRRVLLASSIAPETCRAVRSLVAGRGIGIDGIPWRDDGTVDPAALGALVAAEAASAVVVGMPNAFGIVEPIAAIKAVLPKDTALVIYVADPTALSIFEAPGALGADIVAGDARSLGFPPRLGGVSIGFLTTRKSHLDELPDPIAAVARSTARPTAYLAALGTAGWARLGETCFSLFEYLRRELERVGIPLGFAGQHFREGAFEVPNLERRFKKALAAGIVPGIRLAPCYPMRPELASQLLVAVSSKHRRADLDRLVEVLSHG